MQSSFDFSAPQRRLPEPLAQGRATDPQQTLARLFGHATFRHGQRQLIDAMIARRDALGVMPTGGGKSLCFQLPALCLDGMAIVVSPLIALMKDQVDALSARGIAAAAYHSSLNAEERARTAHALASGKLKLLYIAPERIQHDRFIERLRAARISLLAIDEAHCVSQWGHDFRPDYLRLAELKRGLGNPPCIALTATATRQVQADIIKHLSLNEPVRVVTGFHRANLAFEVAPCATRKQKVSTLTTRLREAGVTGSSGTGSAIIYAATRKNVEWLSEALSGLGIRCGYYHAGLSDSERSHVQDCFARGELRVLVATNAFGMGIDKPDIRLVAHFDIPGSMEAYYQEAGRAGRDGAPARCTLLFNHADVATQEYLLESRGADRAEIARRLLTQLVRYAYAKECRQQLILDYFGDDSAAALGACGRCDQCTKKPVADTAAAPAEELNAATRQVLECVKQMRGRYGKTRVVEVLRGANTAAVRKFGLEELPSYGALRSWKTEELRDILERLVDSGLLKLQGLEYPVLTLSQAGVKALG